MKIKLKPLLITGGILLVATVSLSVGLTFIPVGDKKIEHSSNTKNDDSASSNDSGIPSLPGSNNINEKTKEETIELDDRSKSSDIILANQSVRYFAFGDSIAAGFDSSLDKDYPGSYDPNTKVISGISYPVYLADFISKLGENKLESFHNFAKTSSTTKEWIQLLTYNDIKDNLTEAELNRLHNLFGDNLEEFSQKTIQELSNANLITINLGANDLFDLLLENINNIPIFDLINQARNNNLNYAQLVSSISDSMSNIFDELSNRLSTLNMIVKKYAKTTNINFIGYPLPMPHIFKIIDSAINGENSGSQLINVGSILLDLLNKQVKSNAINKQFNFINAYDQTFWNKYLNLLVPNLFEIHPSSLGYKKMAQDIFVKLILPSRKLSVMNANGINFDQKYFSTDFNSFLLQFDVNNPIEQITKIFDGSMDQFTFKKDPIYNEFDKARENADKNYYDRVLNRKALYKVILDKLFSALFNSEIYKTIDEHERLKNFLYDNNSENLNQIKNWFIDSGFLPKNLLQIQHEYFETDWDNDGLPGALNPNYYHLLQTFKQQFTSETMLIKFIASFFKIPFFENKKDEIKSIFSEIIQNVINVSVDDKAIEDIINWLPSLGLENYISKSDLVYLIRTIINNQELKNALGSLLLKIIDNSDKCAEVQSFNGLWTTFITDVENQKIIKNMVHNVLGNLFEDTRLKEITSKFITKILKTKTLFLTEISNEEVEVLFEKILNSVEQIEQNFKFIDSLVNDFISELSTKPFGQLDFAKIIENSEAIFESKFSGDQLPESILNIVKILVSSGVIEHSETIAKILSNVIVYYKNNGDLAHILANKLTSLSPSILEFISIAELESLIDKTFSTPETYILINNLLNHLLNVDKTEILNVSSIDELIALLFKDITNSKVSNNLIPLLEKVSTFAETRKLFSNVISKYVPNFSESLTIGSIVEILKQLFNNYNFKFVINDFLQKGLFNGSFSLNNFNIENSLKLWLSDAENNNILAEKITLVLKETTKNEAVSDSLAKIIYDLIQNINQNVLEGTNKDKVLAVLSGSLSKISNIDEILNVLQLIIKFALDELGQNGFIFSVETFKQNVYALFTDLYNDMDSFDTKLLNVIKLVITTQEINENSDQISIIGSNLIKLISNNDDYINKISTYIKNQLNDINSYIGVNDLNSSLKKILNSSSFINILKNSLTSILSANNLKVLTSNSLGELFSILLTDLIKNADASEIINFVKEVLDYPEIITLINNLKTQNNNEIFNSLTAEEWIDLAKSILNNSKILNIINSAILAAVKDESFKFTDIFNVNTLLIKILKDNTVNELLKENITTLINELGSNANVLKLLTSSIFYSVPYNNEIFKNISLNEFTVLISKTSNHIEKLNEIFDIYSFIHILLETVKNSEKTTIDVISDISKKYFSDLFTEEKIETKILELLKIIIQVNNEPEVNGVLKKLISNIFEYLIQNNVLQTELVNLVYISTSNFEEIISKDNFINLINKIFQSDSFTAVLDKILSSLLSVNTNDIQPLTLKKVVDKLGKEFIETEEFNKFIETLFNTSKDAEFNNFISKLISKMLNIEVENIGLIVNSVASNQNTISILKNFLNKVVFNDEVELSNLWDADFIIKKWFAENANDTEFKNLAKNLITEIIKDETLTNKLSEFIYSIINSKYPRVFQNIAKEQVVSFLNDLLKNAVNIYSVIDSEFNILDKLFNELATNGLNVDWNDFQNELLISLKDKFSGADSLNAIQSLIKVLNKDQFLTRNKDLVKSLLSNIIRELTNQESILDIINSWFSKTITNFNDYVSKELLKDIIQKTINLESLNSLFSVAIDTIISLETIEHTETLTYNELLKLLINKLNTENHNDSAYVLLTGFLGLNEVKQIIAKLVEVNLPNYSNILNLSTISHLVDSAITDENFAFVLKDFIDKALLNQEIDVNNFDFAVIIKKWLSNEENNKVIASKLAEFVKSQATDNKTVEIASEAIYQLIVSNTTILNNANKQNIIALIRNTLVQLPELDKILQINSSIFEVVLKELSTEGLQINLSQLISKLKDLFNEKIIKNADFDNILLNILKPVLLSGLTTQYVDDINLVLANTIDYVLANSDLKSELINFIYAKVNKLESYISKDDFDVLISEIAKSVNVRAILTDSINAILNTDKNQINSISSLADLTDLLLNTILKNLNTDNVIELLKEVSNKEIFTKLINSMLQQSESDILKGVNSTDLIKIIKLLINDENVKPAIKQTWTEITSKDEFSISQFANWKLILLSLAKSDSFKDLLLAGNNSLITKLLQNSALQKIIGKLIYDNIPSSYKLFENITIDQFNSLFGQIANNYDVLKSIFDINNLLIKIIDYIKSTNGNIELVQIQNIVREHFTNMFSNENIENTILQLFKELNGSISDANKETLKIILSNLIDYLVNSNLITDNISKVVYSRYPSLTTYITKDKFNELLNRVFNQNNFKTVVNELLKKLFSLENSFIQNAKNLKTIINKVIIDFVNNDSFNTLKELLKYVIDDEEFDDLITKLLSKFVSINAEELKQVSHLLINDSDFAYLYKDFIINVLFAENTTFENITDADFLVKKWFTLNQNNTEFKNHVKDFVFTLIQNENVKSTVAKSILEYLKQYPLISSNISNDKFENLIKQLLSDFKGIYELFDNNYSILDELINELAINGINATFNAILNGLLDRFKVKFNKDNFNDFFVVFVRKINENNLITNNKDTIKQLILNIVKMLAENGLISDSLADLIYNANEKVKIFITKDQIKNIMQSTFASSEFTDLLSAIAESLLNIDANVLQTSTNAKQLLDIAFKQIVEQGAFDKVYKVIQKVFEFDDMHTLLQNALNYAFEANPPIFSKETVQRVVELLTNNDNIKSIIKSFLTNAIFNDSITLENLSDINVLLLQWLKIEENKTNASGDLKAIAQVLLNDENVKHVIAILIYKTIAKEEILVKDIDENAGIELIKNMLGSFNTFTQILGLEDSLFSLFIDNLAKNGSNINIEELSNDLFVKISAKFNQDNWENTFVELFKKSVQVANPSQNKSLLNQLLTNIFEYVSRSENIGLKIYALLPEKIKSLINVITPADFNELFTSLFVANEDTKEIINMFIADIEINQSQYENATSLIDILKIFIKNKDNITKLSTRLENIFAKSLEHDSIKKLLTELWKKNISPYGVDVNSAENIAFVNDLLQELPELFRNLKLISKTLEAINQSIESTNNISEFLSALPKALLNSLELKEYSFVKTILNSKVAQTHHEVLKQDILQVINGITSNDELLNKLISDFDLVSLMTGLGLTQEKANTFWNQLFKSENVKTILSTLLNEVLDNVSEYAKLNSWTEVLSKIFQSSNITTVREALKAWYKQATENAPEIFNAVGTIIAGELKKSGYTIDTAEEGQIQKFMLSLAKAIPHTRILDDIIDAVFEEIKNMSSRTDNSNFGTNILGAIKRGALKFISNSSGKVSLSKIFDNIPVFKTLMNNLNAEDYSNFINILFSSAPVTTSEGLYKMMFDSKSNDNPVEVGASGIWDIIRGKLEDLISAFITPLMNNYLRELEEKQTYNTVMEVKQNIQGYQSIWRVYSFLAAILYTNTPSGLFWNATNLTSEAKLRNGFRNAYIEALKQHPTVYDKYKNNLKVIGLSGQNNPNTEFWAGMDEYWYTSTSNRISYRWYGSDFVLAYIYYQDWDDHLYNKGKTLKQALVEAMHTGYMPMLGKK
ncbi:SGNH/GDSL hydrolase family protein [Mycoplasmopsis felifaucium]|uniref:SGNH/GDSL hydrolase family protein n=1 Tax=Mycoplasmopsis felifaucium TaxID=35768 RepID=UPI000488C2B3|nr:SGNH/GDSL hydrolase family protein [Mycoplasmopsis felifaucium]